MQGVKGTTPPHGNYGRYVNHGCRCEQCREAWRIYWTERAHATGRHKPMAEYLSEVVRHGYSRYGHGCRCDECREAARKAWRRQKQRQRATNSANPQTT